MALSTCAACSYIVRNRLARCQTVLLTIELLLLALLGHHELAMILLVLTVSLVLLAFFAGICDLALTLTKLSADNTLELGAGFVDSLQKSPLHARAIALAIQSYQRYLDVATEEDGGYTDVVLKVPALRYQLRTCHYFINFMVRVWIAVISCYSIFTLASVPLETSRLPHIYAVFGVFMLIALLGIVDVMQLVMEDCCSDSKRQVPKNAVQGANQPNDARILHEQRVLEFIERDEKAKLEGTLQSITLGSASNSTAPSSAIAETVDRMQHHVKLRTGPLIE